jgi:MOSC domain-containing protein YiiM
VEQRHSRNFEQHLARIGEDSTDGGRLELIVRRPAVDEREVLTEAMLDEADGLVGDGWAARGSRSTPDGSADPDAQLTVMSTRVLEAIEPDRRRWPLAGDQLYVDFDLSLETLPAGSRLAIGTAVIEVSETPHTGCAKFSARFGSEALRWINSPVGRAHRMRGLNARIVEGGMVRTGDAVRRVETHMDGSQAG